MPLSLTVTITAQITAMARAGAARVPLTKPERTREVMIVERRVVDRAAVKRAVTHSTRASAKLERRVVPIGFVRSQRAQRFLAERRKHA